MAPTSEAARAALGAGVESGLGARAASIRQIHGGEAVTLAVSGPAERRQTRAALRRAGYLALRSRPGEDALARYDPGADRWTLVRIAPERRAGRPPPSRRRPALRRGIDVALLAPDGAGKSTLCAALVDGLPIRAWSVHMELYSPERRTIAVPGLRLATRIGRQWGRWSCARLRRAAGTVVLFDRYPYDARLAASGSQPSAVRFVRGLLGRLLPPPRLALVLDAPAEVVHSRKPERSVAELERLRLDYRALATRLPCRCEVLDASGPLDEVRRRAVGAIWSVLAAPSQAEPGARSAAAAGPDG
jgi:thymidylate kinase